MEGVLGVAGIAGAVAGSVGLALWLEWVSLRWLLSRINVRPSDSSHRNV